MKSELILKTKNEHHKTVIQKMYFTPPLKIISPFYDDYDRAEIMLLSASAGLLEGDKYHFDYTFGENSKVRISSQSYEKIFKCSTNSVLRDIHMQLQPKADVIFMPHPIIPFQGSRFIGRSTICADKTASLIYGDIISCGRVGMGERFQMDNYDNIARFYIGNELVFIDHTRINPGAADFTKLGFWNAHTHTGMLFVSFPEPARETELIQRSRDIGKAFGLYMGATRCKKGILIRVLADSGEIIRCFMEEIIRTISC